MITVRTSNLTSKEIDELYHVLNVAKTELCIDSPTKSCANCEYRKLCNNFRYVLKYLEECDVKREK